MKIAAAIAILSVFAASTANAQSALQAAPRLEVSYADLNLSSAAGRATLENRIDAAIGRVCPDSYPGDWLSSGANWTKNCRASAREGAQRQLAAVYANHQFAQTAVVVSDARK